MAERRLTRLLRDFSLSGGRRVALRDRFRDSVNQKRPRNFVYDKCPVVPSYLEVDCAMVEGEERQPGRRNLHLQVPYVYLMHVKLNPRSG